MDRVIIRFLSGAQANQERSFTATELAQGLTAGRDPGARIEHGDVVRLGSSRYSPIRRRPTA